MMALNNIQTEEYENLINLTGKTTLEDVLNIIACASFVIGNETGPIHIASLWSIPTIMFYGGGHFGGLLPKKAVLVGRQLPCYFCNWNCTHPDRNKTPSYPCISQIDQKTLEITLHNFIQNHVT